MTGTSQRLAAALVGRYRIERELGTGGMATVYLAHDLRHDRDVAIKVLHPDLGAALGGERFLAEIRTTARLQHPHILPLLDSGEADGLLYYVMPVATGETLRDRLTRERQLPLEDALRITREVADALGHAHALGIIHRDIKPENILLQGGHALVADFGIALAVQQAGGQRMTQTGLSLGTPQYMSPEQAMGERTIDARSDVYALGAVAYEMLAGEAPFTGPSVQAIVAKVLNEKPVPLHTLRDTVPWHVEQAVLRALAKLPADRFATATRFAEALAEPASAEGSRATMTGSRTPASRGVRPVMVAALAAAALLAGAAGASLLVRDRGPAPVIARMQLFFPAGQELRSTQRASVTLSPDGSRMVYTGPGASTRTQLWVRALDRLQGERLSQSADESCCAAFSPSGDTVAYLTPPRTLRVLPLNGGVATELPDPGLTSVSDWGGGLDWGTDGRLYASSPKGLLRIDPRSGAAELAAMLDSARGDMVFLWPSVLPGARGAIVTVVPQQGAADPERASIGIADFSSRRVEILLQGVRAIHSPTGHLVVVRANGALQAVPFDAGRLRATGTARDLPDTVWVGAGANARGVVSLSLARNGTLVYASGGEGSYRTVWVDRAGKSRPVDEEPAFGVIDGPALAPDGRRVALAGGGLDRTLHLWIQHTDGSPRSRLTFEGAINHRARWRPGTNRVSYLTDSGGVTSWRIVDRDAGGQGTRRFLATGDPRSVGSHAWSPDGTWLVFRTSDQAEGTGDILAIRPGVDTVARALVATPAEELAPSVSPDGRWLSYTSNESGRREVYVRPFPEAGGGRHQVTTAGGIAPVWNPRGGELLYVDATLNLVAVPVTTGASFSSGQPRRLFSVADYYNNPYQPQFEVSPDGERFLMVLRETRTTSGVVVVFGFLEALKRRMAER